ncbi:MAG: sulfur carrier protein ThiS [Desulfobacteraceae bacterium]|nr:sulfur carrier protein ThiS [Desulfobacteraceae bacterium]
MKINLNGNPITIKSHSLLDLVLEQGFNPVSLIVEYNQEVVKQESWEHIHIKEMDSVELLSFVGGG